MSYLPSVTPPEKIEEGAFWFAFCGSALLMSQSGERMEIPMAHALQELGVKALRTQYLGPEEMLVGAKIALASTNELATVAAAIDAAEAAVRAAVPTAQIIYLEPDLDRSASR